MALFEYKALDASGKQIKGLIDADTSKQARQKLRGQSIFPTEITEGKKKEADSSQVEITIFSGISKDDLSIMTRQFATLVRAGLPIVESLSALVDQLENKKLSKIIANIREDVREGSSLAESMGKFPKVFSNIYVNLVMAGEKSGTLETMLERVADNLEAQVKQAKDISSILLYPVIMLTLGLVIVGFLVVSVIPKIVSIFEGMEKALPLPTIILIKTSDFLINWWHLIIIFIGMIIFAATNYASSKKGRNRIDTTLLKLPFYGRVLKMIAVSRLTRTLSTLISSGVPLLEAMNISKKVVNNTHMESVLEDVTENIREGESIAEPLKRSGLFPPLLIHMIAIGEKSGELESMLIKVADVYDNEVKTVVDKLTALLPVIITIFLAFIVTGIILAILMPLLNLSSGMV